MSFKAVCDSGYYFNPRLLTVQQWFFLFFFFWRYRAQREKCVGFLRALFFHYVDTFSTGKTCANRQRREDGFFFDRKSCFVGASRGSLFGYSFHVPKYFSFLFFYSGGERGYFRNTNFFLFLE